VFGVFVLFSSAHSAITVQAKLMEGVNPDTVWTWNAVGKQSGAWNLDPDAAESKRGFLLNHLIRDLLPPRDGGYRYTNSDPVTGQAAWYDLRVKIEKAVGKHDHSEPVFKTLKTPPLPERPGILRYGKRFRPQVQPQ
jgi:anaerobic selenocysteine-containing dehydrogenase